MDLRFFCPCAGCVNEVTGVRTIERSQVRNDVQPVGVNVVGRYAIKIDWNDGHSTGMYSFEKLYDLCKEAGKIVNA